VQYSYLVVDNDGLNTESLQRFENFPEYFCVGIAVNKDEAINKILELKPQLVFLEINPKVESDLSLAVITELYRYINVLPAFIVLADTREFAYDALKLGAFDYLLKPVNNDDLRKCLFRFIKQSPAEYFQAVSKATELQPTLQPIETDKVTADVQRSDVDIQICIKSYGDYQFIALKDIIYLKADNNTTDFYLKNGKKLTAYKTLKHYENNLPSYFYRIHNSYIVNSNYVSRINTGKLICYLDDNEISVSFSKTFKDNIDTIIRQIAPEYL
jgi:two-component system LytT family response regulator